MDSSRALMSLDLHHPRPACRLCAIFLDRLAVDLKGKKIQCCLFGDYGPAAGF